MTTRGKNPLSVIFSTYFKKFFDVFVGDGWEKRLLTTTPEG